MGQQNYEDIIRAAYVRSLLAAGIPEDEAKKTADSAQYRNQFKRAEIIAYREEKEHDGAVPIAELSEYVAGKYGSGYTVTGQGVIEVEEIPLVYTLADFKAEVLACKNQYHLKNWSEKHAKRIKRHLTEEDELDELRKFVSDRLAELRGDPPMPDEPPKVDSADVEEDIACDEQAEDEPSTWQLAVEFDALCTEEQIKQLAGEVSKILRASPFVVDGSCKMVTR